MTSLNRDVRFTPKSGHSELRQGTSLSASLRKRLKVLRCCELTRCAKRRHSGWAILSLAWPSPPRNADLVNINSKVACDDPIVDQNQDSCDRRRNDRPHGDYGGAVADIGNPSWSSARADDKQLYSSLRKPGAQQYPLAGKGLGASPHGDRKVSVV